MKVKLNASGSAALKKAIQDIKGAKVQVGWFDTARYVDGTPVAYVAAIQEFGHGAIPARPFMRPTIAEQRNAWRETLRKGMNQVIQERLTVEQMLLAFGLNAAGDIAQAIRKVTAPPLSMTTLILRAQKKKDGFQAGGKAVGKAFREANFVGPVPKKDRTKLNGVSTKPLVDTALMLQSITAQVSR